jgi:hypothetical protein
MSSRLTRDDVRALGLEILRGKPDPAVRVRLLRDVLHADREDPRLCDARAALEDSVHVALLRGEQREDGSWGRLHSRDTAARQAVLTTEWAVERAVALGMDPQGSMLLAAERHLASLVDGQVHAPDPPERNDRWTTGVRLFAAATLCRISPGHPSLDSVWELWHEIAKRSLASGSYNADAEADAHRELTGASVRGTYLVLCNRYTLTLLASRAVQMDGELRHRIGLWVGHRGDGVGYYGLPLSAPSEELSVGDLERFLLSHEVVARFGAPAAATATGPLADWFGRHRRGDGLWDLGPRASWTPELPLSESWKRANARSIDWTTRLLALFRQWLA